MYPLAQTRLATKRGAGHNERQERYIRKGRVRLGYAVTAVVYYAVARFLVPYRRLFLLCEVIREVIVIDVLVELLELFLLDLFQQ